MGVIKILPAGLILRRKVCGFIGFWLKTDCLGLPILREARNFPPSGTFSQLLRFFGCHEFMTSAAAKDDKRYQNYSKFLFHTHIFTVSFVFLFSAI